MDVFTTKFNNERNCSISQQANVAAAEAVKKDKKKKKKDKKRKLDESTNGDVTLDTTADVTMDDGVMETDEPAVKKVWFVW